MSEFNGDEDWAPAVPGLRPPTIPLEFLVRPNDVRRGRQFVHFNLFGTSLTTTYRRLWRSTAAEPLFGTFLSDAQPLDNPGAKVLLTNGEIGQLTLAELGIAERSSELSGFAHESIFTVHRTHGEYVMRLVQENSQLRSLA